MRKKVKDNPNKGLSFLYNTKIGRIILKPLVASPIISNIIGKFMDSKMSKIMIKHFIKNNNINLDDYEPVLYRNFNDFFARKIKNEKRVIIKDKDAFITPCDAKLTCYKINSELTFNIKKSTYSVSSMIKDDRVAKSYDGGYVLVFRLSPDDYHHYRFLDDGKIIKHYRIDGCFHTVNPIVYDKFEVFKENTRECTLIDTKNFGKVMQIEVGALLVGKIKNVKTEGNFVKGEEKGYFVYGGSTVVVLVQKNVIKVDQDIIKNSLEGFETCVLCGEKIAKKIK